MSYREPAPPVASSNIEVTALETIDAPLAEIARRLCDFRTLHEWHPAFGRCAVEGEGEGAIRTLDMGGAAVRERLEHLAEDGLGYSYSVLQHPLLGVGSRATLLVRGGATEGQGVLEWSVTIEPTGVLPPAALADMVKGLCAMGLAAAKHTLHTHEPVEASDELADQTDVSWGDASWGDVTIPDVSPPER